MAALSVQPDKDARLFTCILPKGAGLPLVQALHDYGITASNLSYARGSDVGEPAGKDGIPFPSVKEIVTVVVPGNDAEKMFDYVIEKGNLERPGGGFIYVCALDKAVPFVLPVLPDPVSGEIESAVHELSIPTDSDTRMITCILPKGSGKPLLEALHGRGITASNMYYARGSDVGDAPGRKGVPDQVEKEIVTVVVESKAAEELFEFIVETAQIDRPGGGLIYQGELRKSVPFILPDVPAEPKLS